MPASVVRDLELAFAAGIGEDELFVGALFQMCGAGLRWSDIQRLELGPMVLQDDVLRSCCWSLALDAACLRFAQVLLLH